MQVTPGIIEGITDEEYFSIDAMNASRLKNYDESINHGLWADAQPSKSSHSLSYGTLVHAYVLEGPDVFADLINDQYLIGGPINPKTNEVYGKATKKFSEWIEENANGRKVISQKDYDDVVKVSTAVKNHAHAYETLLRCPKREAVIIWVDKETGVLCKAKMDMYGGPIGCDLKTSARMENKFQIMREIRKWKYDIQFSFYFDGAQAAGLPVSEFRAIFAGTSDELDVGCFKITAKSLANGRDRYKNALRRYIDAQNGVRRGRFPLMEDVEPIEAAFSGQGA